MINKITVKHHIQKHILNVLMRSEFSKFSNMRPPKTDSNLYSYHLKLMQKNGLVEKTDAGYRLSHIGVDYALRLGSEDTDNRNQPEVIVMLLIQNSDGEVLLQKRNTHPYINQWGLPFEKLNIDDSSIQAAANRVANEDLGLIIKYVKHIGDVYIRVGETGSILTSSLAHIFRFNSDDIELKDANIWVRPHKLGQHRLAPAVEQIITRAFFNDPFFFEEYDVELGD